MGPKKMHLGIDLNVCYAMYRKHLKITDYRDETVRRKDLELLIEQNFRRTGYVRHKNELINFCEGQRSGVIFDLTRQNLVDVNQFPEKSERSEYTPGRADGWHDY